MDFFSHLAWTYLLLFRGRPDLLQALFFGVFPDVIFVGAAIVFSINLFARTRQISRQKLFPLVKKAYQIGHSLITVAVFVVIASFLNGAFYFPVLAWVLHILLDLYTHRGSPAEPQMPLYPLTKPSIKGFIWWRNPYFMAANWALIAIVYFFTK